MIDSELKSPITEKWEQTIIAVRKETMNLKAWPCLALGTEVEVLIILRSKAEEIWI